MHGQVTTIYNHVSRKNLIMCKTVEPCDGRDTAANKTHRAPLLSAKGGSTGLQ